MLNRSVAPVILVSAVLAAGLGLSGCGTEAGQVEIRAAKFVASDAPTPPPADARWESKSLPDPWAASEPPRTGFGWYRLELPAIPVHGRA